METVTDFIIAVAPVGTSPLQSESPHGCQLHTVLSDPLRSINILSSGVKGASSQRPEKRTVTGTFFFSERRNQVRLQERNGRDTCSLREMKSFFLRVPLFFPAQFIFVKLSQRLERRAHDRKSPFESQSSHENVGYSQWKAATVLLSGEPSLLRGHQFVSSAHTKTPHWINKI